MNQQFKVGILTISDSGSIGKRKDVSGAILEKFAVANNLTISLKEIIPDDFDQIHIINANLNSNFKNMFLSLYCGNIFELHILISTSDQS